MRSSLLSAAAADLDVSLHCLWRIINIIFINFMNY